MLNLLLITLCITSSILLYLRYTETKNALLLGKILSRLLALLTLNFTYHEAFIVVLVTIFISDIIYDGWRFVYKLIDYERRHIQNKYIRILDNVDAAVITIRIQDGKIIYFNRYALQQFPQLKDFQSIYQLIPDFRAEEGNFSYSVDGKVCDVTTLVSKNAVDTLTLILR